MARPSVQSDDRSPYFDGPERRSKPRKNVIEVELVTVDLGQGQGALLLDISESGMGVQALPGIQLGSSVPVSFDLPDTREHVDGTGTIVWNDRGGRAGVLFRDLAPPVKARLRNWLNQTQPAVQLASEAAPVTQESTIFLALSSENLGELDYLRDQIAGLEVNSALAVIAEQSRVMARATGLAIALSDGTSYVCRASTGSAPGIGVRLHLNAGLSGECIRTGQIVRCEDTESDPRVDPVVCQRMGLRSAVLVPLKRDDILVGVLEAFSDRPNAFASADVLMLRRVCELIIQIGGSEMGAAEEWSEPPEQAAEKPAAESGRPEVPPLPVTPVPPHAAETPHAPETGPAPVLSPAAKPEMPAAQAAAAPPLPVAPVAEPAKTPAVGAAGEAATSARLVDKHEESSKAATSAPLEKPPAQEKPAAKPLPPPPKPGPVASAAGNERLKPVVSPVREAVIPVATPAPSKLPVQGRPLVPQVPAPVRPPAVEVPETKPSPQFDVPHTFLEQEETPADPRVRKALQIAAILLAVVLGSWFLYREGTSRPVGKPAASAPGQQAQNSAPPVAAPSAPAASASESSPGNRGSAKASREKASPEQSQAKAASAKAARETAPMVLPPSNKPAEPEEVVVRPVPPDPADVAVHSGPPGLPAPSVASPVLPAPPRPAPTVAANLSASPAGAPSAPARPVSKGVTGGRLLHRVEPTYPPMGRTMQLQGAVQLRATVTPKGTVAKMTVVRGQPVLAQAAMDAVKQWRYEPFSLDGTPVQMDVDIIVYFTIPR